MQVQANIIYRGNTHRVKKHLEEIQEIMKMSHDSTLTIGRIKNEIINFVRIDYLTQIRKAIKQKTRFVFIDGTQSSVGLALDKCASDNNINFSIQKSLSDALTLYETDNNFIPSIFAAGACDYNYRLSSICLRIPVVKTEPALILDDDKLDSISVINE